MLQDINDQLATVPNNNIDQNGLHKMFKQFKFWHSDTDTAPKLEIKKTMKTHTYKYKFLNSNVIVTICISRFENVAAF